MQNTPVHNSLSSPISHLLSLSIPHTTLIITYHYVAKERQGQGA